MVSTLHRRFRGSDQLYVIRRRQDAVDVHSYIQCTCTAIYSARAQLYTVHVHSYISQLYIADVVMRRVYGALLVAMLVVCCVCAESGCV